jgi:hypothetical protein
LNATGAAAAVIAVVAAVALGPLGHGGTDGAPPPQIADTPTATVSPTPPRKSVDAGALDLDYTQTGNTVTATLDGRNVATVTFKTWAWSGSAGSVVLTVDARQTFTIDPMTFSVDGSDGYNENSPMNEDLVRVPAGNQDVTLRFPDVEGPTGLKWTPQDGKATDGESTAGFWTLPAANKK